MLAAIIMWAVVFFIGVPAAWRNPTAAALSISWILGEIIFLNTGNPLPTRFYLIPDLFVLAVIIAKPEPCDLRPYMNAWHQAKCMVLERAPADRVVMLIFPVMWIIYASDLSAPAKWYGLWALCIVQFLAAGFEALTRPAGTGWTAQHPKAPNSDDASRFAWGRGYG